MFWREVSYHPHRSSGADARARYKTYKMADRLSLFDQLSLAVNHDMCEEGDSWNEQLTVLYWQKPDKERTAVSV